MLRFLLLSVFILSLPSEAMATQEEPIQEFATFKDCLKVKDEAVRFICYETFANGEIYSARVARIEKEKVFGTKKKSSNDTLASLLVTIVKTQKSTAGTMYFTTGDGQLWKQKDKGRLRFQSIPFEAIIKKKIISGYLLSPTDSNSSVTIVRVK